MADRAMQLLGTVDGELLRIVFFLIALLCTALLGELFWRRARIPRVLTYVIAGCICGLIGVSSRQLDGAAELVITAAVSLALFEAGRHCNLSWLLRNPWLVALASGVFWFGGAAAFGVACWFGLAGNSALLCAIVTAACSPIVVQQMAGEARAAGHLTSLVTAISTLCTLQAALVAQVLIALNQEPLGALAAGDWPSPIARTVGAILLGIALGSLIGVSARHLDMRRQESAVPLALFILLTISVADVLHLSRLIVPIVAGLWLRNRFARPWVFPRQLGSLGAMLTFVMIFWVASAAARELQPESVLVALAICSARWLVSSLAILATARPAGLSHRQAPLLGAALLPVSATGWILAGSVVTSVPAFYATTWPMLAASVLICELVGGWTTYVGLRVDGDIPAPVAGSEL